MRRLYDKAADVALLHHLVLAGRQWQGPELVRETIEWLGWGDKDRDTLVAITAGMHAVLRGWRELGILEHNVPRHGGIEWRLAEHVSSGDIKRLTGGIDPVRYSAEECLELDLPSVAGLRRVEFEPDAYLKARGEHDRRERAYWQCPSPFELGRRMKTLDNGKHTTRKARRSSNDEHAEAAAA